MFGGKVLSTVNALSITCKTAIYIQALINYCCDDLSCFMTNSHDKI